MALAQYAGPARFGNFGMDMNDMDARGDAFWGRNSGIRDGTPVDLVKAQDAAIERAINAFNEYPYADFVMPLRELIDPGMIRKAALTFGYAESGKFASDIQKAQDWFVGQLDLKRKDTKNLENLEKAMSTSSNLMHTIVDDDIAMLFQRLLVVQSLIGVEANRGKIASWDAITTAGSPYFGSEDPTFTESDITDATRTATCKIMYAVVKVTKMAQIAGSTQVPSRDMMSIRMMAAQDSIKQLRERSLLGVTRDINTTSNAYADAGTLEYAGIYELITNNTAAPLYSDVSSSTINTWDTLSPYLDTTYTAMVQKGRIPTVAICDHKTFGIIRRGLFNQALIDPVKEVNAGFNKINLVMANGTVPLITVPVLPTTAGTNGNLFFLETPALKRRTLWAETYEDIASGNTSKMGVVSASEVLIDKTDYNASDSRHGGVFGITIT